ncbi:hypothetical protein ACSBR2_037607 [Camellia fascicularis]
MKIFMSKYYCVRLHALFGTALAAGLVAARTNAGKYVDKTVFFFFLIFHSIDFKICVANGDLKKERRQFLTQFFSPIFLKAFSITFFGEWGDKSQIATIGLAADENPLGVVLGGILGQAFCTTAAVLGGKSLAS